MAQLSVSTKVRGLTALLRALEQLPDDVDKQFINELKEAVSPTQPRAQTLMHELSNVSDPYDTFKIGISRNLKKVWIAPAWPQRGGPKRAKFGTAILERERKAVEEERPRIIDKIDDMLDRIATHHGF